MGLQKSYLHSLTNYSSRKHKNNSRISKTQRTLLISYIKDTTDFINFLDKTKVPQNTILVSMDVTSLYTNIPQEEGIDTVCRAYETFHKDEPPVPTRLLEKETYLTRELIPIQWR